MRKFNLSKVYYLSHTTEFPGGLQETLTLGVYSSEVEVKKALERLIKLPEFIDRTDGFFFEPFNLNEDGWTSGYGPSRPGDEFYQDEDEE